MVKCVGTMIGIVLFIIVVIVGYNIWKYRGTSSLATQNAESVVINVP